MTDFQIAGISIAPGERRRVQLQMAPLYDFTPTTIPVEVIRGTNDGPVLFVCAAIHGDEINGVDIIRRLLLQECLSQLNGTLIAAPIVNVFGFNDKSRYLPDRRDLNRCFPGAEDGSLAAQMAHLFMKEIVAKATHGIDLHTGAIHRKNLPQIRACLDDAETFRLATQFGAPVMINSDLRDGSLREVAREQGVKMLLYEAGEALRFDEDASRIGLRGILRVMEVIGMLSPAPELMPSPPEAFLARSSHWIRASYSGILERRKSLGERVKAGELLGVISDPFGTHRFELLARHDGIVIGISLLPLFNKGDAVLHIATFDDMRAAEALAEARQPGLRTQADTYLL